MQQRVPADPLVERAQLVGRGQLAVEKTLKSPEWAKILKTRGWDDAYMNADQFAAFLKTEQVRVKEVLSSIGLVK